MRIIENPSIYCIEDIKNAEILLRESLSETKSLTQRYQDQIKQICNERDIYVNEYGESQRKLVTANDMCYATHRMFTESQDELRERESKLTEYAKIVTDYQEMAREDKERISELEANRAEMNAWTPQAIKEAVAAGREVCALLCEEEADSWAQTYRNSNLEGQFRGVAARIRKRNEVNFAPE